MNLCKCILFDPFSVIYPLGILCCLDGFMNVALEQTQEFIDGKLTQNYGDTFIRGNNILFISQQTKK